MSKLIHKPIRPYRRALFLVLAGLLVETAAAIAQARPLKIILDNVLGRHYLPPWLTTSVGPPPSGANEMHVAVFAALLLVAAIEVANVIAHRASATRRAHSVVRITGGALAEVGPNAELDEAQYETKALAA